MFSYASITSGHINAHIALLVDIRSARCYHCNGSQASNSDKKLHLDTVLSDGIKFGSQIQWAP